MPPRPQGGHKRPHNVEQGRSLCWQRRSHLRWASTSFSSARNSFSRSFKICSRAYNRLKGRKSQGSTSTDKWNRQVAMIQD